MQNEIKKLAIVQAMTHTKDDVKNVLATYLDGDKSDLNYQRKFVNSVFVYDDKVVIYYNVFSKTQIDHTEALKDIAENERVFISNILAESLGFEPRPPVTVLLP